MVDLIGTKCQNCGFHQKLLVGTSNPDQVYNDLNDDFNYYKIFYCPKHNILTNVEIFNQSPTILQQLEQQHNNNYWWSAAADCEDSIEISDVEEIIRSEIICPRWTRTKLKAEFEEMLETKREEK